MFGLICFAGRETEANPDWLRGPALPREVRTSQCRALYGGGH